MTTFTVQARTPGAGGSWTTIGSFTALAVHQEVSQLWAIDTTVWNPSGSEKALLIQGNDFRVLIDGGETAYGQIRSAVDDPYTNSRGVHATSKAILAQDRSWPIRKAIDGVAANSVVDEILNDPCGQPKFGLGLWYDFTTFDANSGNLTDLSGNGYSGALSNYGQILGRWGFGAKLFSTSVNLSVACGAGTPLDFTGAMTVAFFIGITPGSGGVDKDLISHMDGVPHGWRVQCHSVNISTAQLILYIGVGGGSQSGAGSPSFPGTSAISFHAAVVLDGTGNAQWYKNGVPWGSPVAVGVTPTTNSANLQLGSNSGVLAPDIYTDELQAWNRALSAGEVALLVGTNIFPGGLLADTFDTLNFASDPTDRLAIVDGVAKAIAAEWFTDRDGSDNDRFRFVIPRPYSTTVPSGSVLWYDMEHFVGGQMRDLSGGGNPGTVNGTTDAPGEFGRARAFNGTSDNITTPDSVSLKPTTAVTVAAWVKVSASPTNTIKPICSKSTSEHFGWKMWWDNRVGHGWLWWEIGDGNVANFWQLLPTVSFAAGSVHHVCCVFDSTLATNQMKVYIDGTLLLGSGSTVPPGTTMAHNTDPVLIGEWGSGPTYGDWQFIDEPLVFPSALTPTQVATLATPPKTFQQNVNILRLAQKLDREIVRNDVIILGSGDGAKQIVAESFHATTLRTALTTVYNSGATTSIPVGSTAGFPTQGVVYIGQERVYYNGIDSTHLGTTSVTRAYSADGQPSAATYTHLTGTEVFLHVDRTTSPATCYAVLTPQTGSSIQQNGWRQVRITDRAIKEQVTADRLAQQLLAGYINPRESVTLETQMGNPGVALGDYVIVLNADGTPYQNSPYRVVVLDFDWEEVAWTFTLANPRDLSDFLFAQANQAIAKLDAWGQGYVQVDPTTGAVSGTGVTASVRSGTPTVNDIPAGTYQVWKDSGGGNVFLYYNDAGTLKKTQLT